MEILTTLFLDVLYNKYSLHVNHFHSSDMTGITSIRKQPVNVGGLSLIVVYLLNVSSIGNTHT